MSLSILNTTKGALGLAETHTAFDSEIVMYINSVLSRLAQLGVGPSDGYAITGPSELWSDFIGDNKLLNNVKSYVYLRVKLMFDPPEVGFVLSAMNDMIKEEEWRLNVTVDDELPPKEVVVNG